MATTNRALTLEEQGKLWAVMRKNKIQRTYIAEINKVTNKYISDICLGKENITPNVITKFKNAGIDLEKILIREYRPLTFKEQGKLYVELRKRNIYESDIARINNVPYSMINKICNGEYCVTPVVVNYFKMVRVDLNKIMGE